MESLSDGSNSSSKTQNSASVMGSNPPSTSGTRHPSRAPSPKQSRNGGDSPTSYVTVQSYGTKTILCSNGSVVNQKNSYKADDKNIQHEELPNMAKYSNNSSKGKPEYGGPNDVHYKPAETLSQKNAFTVEKKSCIKYHVDDSKNCDPSGLRESESFASGPCKGSVGQINCHLTSQSAVTFCSSPQNSLYSATLYSEAKQSFTNTEVSECASSVEKSGESGDVTNSCEFIESRTTSICRGSTGSDVSDESSSSCLSSAMYKPHKVHDVRWEAIQAVRSRDGMVGLNHFKLLRRLGCGDIGSVYLSELTGTRTHFAMKVMDKAALASRKKLLRAQTEREILQSLDHPFLPTLYTHFETEKFSCLVMEFCPGGDLHALRQKQPGKYFPEHAARLETSFPFSLFLYLITHTFNCQIRYAVPFRIYISVQPLAIRSNHSSIETCKSDLCFFCRTSRYRTQSLTIFPDLILCLYF